MTVKAEKKPHVRFRVGEGEHAREITLVGRFAWCLEELNKAGPRGCTPIERPAPRWSHYVYRLRKDWGLAIETIHEAHGGPYSGHHARYVLHTPVVLADDDRGSSRTPGPILDRATLASALMAPSRLPEGWFGHPASGSVA
jgi:hypothetical protein